MSDVLVWADGETRAEGHDAKWQRLHRNIPIITLNIFAENKLSLLLREIELRSVYSSAHNPLVLQTAFTDPQYLDCIENRSTAVTLVCTDKLAQMIEPVIWTQKAFSSSPGGNTDYHKIVHDFSHSLKKKNRNQYVKL